MSLLPQVDGNLAVQKTGLGSSAAMVTSFVGAVLQWFNVVDLDRPGSSPEGQQSRRVVHNLAQLVHANAQGKIGSGFDVAAAVYGSQLYRRFSGELFASCMEEVVDPTALHAAVFSAQWDVEVTPLVLPPWVDMVLGDVCGGSSSTSMVSLSSLSPFFFLSTFFRSFMPRLRLFYVGAARNGKRRMTFGCSSPQRTRPSTFT